MSDSRLTRRNVLGMGCAATAGIAVPYFIPATALGNDDTPPPSERVTLGHIGVGNRGTYLMRNAQLGRGIESVAVADCYQDRRDSAVAEIGGKAYADFREILHRDDIDAVVIATPDHWHVPIALMAAQAGKDTYVEKPLGLTLEQSLLCRKVFQKQNRIFQYGTQQREAKHLQLGHDLVRSGKLGKLKRIEVKAPNGASGGSTTETAVPSGFDYDMWLGPAPEVPYTSDRCKTPGTYWVYDQSIGYLGGWGAHPLDLLVWCYDGDQTGPYTVAGTGVIPTQGLYDSVFDWDMTMQMADGVKITFKHGPNSTKFIGTEARLELTRSSIRAFPKNLLPDDLPSNDHARNTANHIQVFADAIRARQEASSPIDAAVRSDIMSHLCDMAVRTGEKITWDPMKQEIISGEKGRALIGRPMRAPWSLASMTAP